MNILKVYCAKDYLPTVGQPFVLPDKIEINIPDNLPTLPKNSQYTIVSLDNNYFANDNYPIGANTIKMYNSLLLPFSKGSLIPSTLKMGTPLLLTCYNDKVEEGYLSLI